MMNQQPGKSKWQIPKGTIPIVLTSGFFEFVLSRTIHVTGVEYFIFSLGVIYIPAVLVGYLVGAVHGIDNTYNRTTEIIEALESQNKTIADLKLELDELKTYIYRHLG